MERVDSSADSLDTGTDATAQLATWRMCGGFGGGPVTLSFTRDDHVLLGTTGALVTLDRQTGSATDTRWLPYAGEHYVLSPDGKYLLTNFFAGNIPTVTLLDAADLRTIWSVNMPFRQSRVGFTPDGKFVFGIDKALHLWRTGDGSPLRILQDLPPVEPVAPTFSSDGTLMAMALAQVDTFVPSAVIVVRLPDGAELARISGEFHGHPVAFTADGSMLVLDSGQLVRIKDSQVVFLGIGILAVSGDDKWLFRGDGLYRFCTQPNCLSARTWSVPVPGYLVSSARFSHDGRTAGFVASDHSAYVVDVATATLVRMTYPGGRNSYYGHVRAGALDIPIVGDGLVALIDPDSVDGKPATSMVRVADGSIAKTLRSFSVVAPSSDGATLWGEIADSGTPRLGMKRVADERVTWSIPLSATELFPATALSSDGKLLAMRYGAAVRLYDAQGGALLQELYGSMPASLLAFSSDGALLVAFSADPMSMTVWTLPEGKLVRQFSIAPCKATALTVAGSGPSAHVVCDDGHDAFIQRWRLDTGSRADSRTLSGLYPRQFSPDGTRVVGSANVVTTPGATVGVMNLEQGTLEATFTELGFSSQFGFSADGRTLVATGDAYSPVRFFCRTP
jgi:WD40 repeat protein